VMTLWLSSPTRAKCRPAAGASRSSRSAMKPARNSASCRASPGALRPCPAATA
jgi:hypothetical protein